MTEQTLRVQIPAWSDNWMRGDRYGEVVKCKDVRPSLAGDRYAYRNAMNDDGTVTMAWVKLDKSGKTFVYAIVDCTVI